MDLLQPSPTPPRSAPPYPLGDISPSATLSQVSSRLAPLGRKGHTASVACIRGQSRVVIFGGAPAGRRGLSNALYSVDLAKLGDGEGTWERHQPRGTPPAPRQGHSMTAVAGGKRLVLFGGIGDGGGILGDVQVPQTHSLRGSRGRGARGGAPWDYRAAKIIRKRYTWMKVSGVCRGRPCLVVRAGGGARGERGKKHMKHVAHWLKRRSASRGCPVPSRLSGWARGQGAAIT